MTNDLIDTDDSTEDQSSTDRRGVSEFLTVLGLASVLVMLLADPWQAQAVGGAVAIGVAVIAVRRERGHG